MFSDILSSTFETPLSNPKLFLIRSLKLAHPGYQSISICQCSDGAFPLSGYLKSVNISVQVDKEVTHEIVGHEHCTNWNYVLTLATMMKFTYESTEFIVYKATWDSGDWKANYFYHLAFKNDDITPGKNLTKAVYKWANSLKEEVWVFEEGFWSKDKSLHKSIRSSNLDSIVLKNEFREGLRRDVETFFSNKDTYSSLNITWKRGILLLGPPGNGKTETIKALLNEFKGVEALYVKSFTTSDGPEKGVRSIFAHAREHTPCILVLEDLDSMVTSGVRSFFLNELDGLAKNEGILTIATTNHPERIDDAILNRPSRFDVKYDFSLPEHDLRKEFALKWLKKIEDLGNDTGVFFEDADRTATLVADKTDSWSFAFLKELFISFTLRVAHDKAHKSKTADLDHVVERSEALLLNQVERLASQIVKAQELSEDQNEVESTVPAGPLPWIPPTFQPPVHAAHDGVAF